MSCRMRCWALRLSFRLACSLRSVARVRAGWRACAALWDAERLRVSCCCFLMCGMGATGNRIGVVVSDRVACASRICAAASREAPLVAARCRLALAMGLVSRLCEHSVLVDCPLDCISICGTYCSTRLAIRFLVAKSTEHSGASRDDTSSSVSEEGVPHAHASNA